MFKVCIVEDQGYRNLKPMTKTRPAFALRCGRFTLEERIIQVLDSFIDQVHYLMRPELEPVWMMRNAAPSHVSFKPPEHGRRLYLNGRMLFHEQILRKLLEKAEGEKAHIWLTDSTWAAIYLPEDYSHSPGEELTDNGVALSAFENQSYLDVEEIVYPWDLIRCNSAMLRMDYSRLFSQLDRLRYPPLPKQVVVINGDKLIIGKHAEIYPFVTFDASRGPILVGNNVTIESGAYIQGPVSIGNNCLVSANSRIYRNTTLGSTCKAGGEISHSIIHGYSNKRHEGFLGNSYLGEWVNLGAGTNVSNMKNNYNKVTVKVNGDTVDTGTQFVGLFMGDHARTAVNTSFNTASFVGVGCNIFGEGVPPRHLPDFTWGGNGRTALYNFPKFIENARRMMIRREVEIRDPEIRLLKSLHDCRKVTAENNGGAVAGEIQGA